VFPILTPWSGALTKSSDLLQLFYKRERLQEVYKPATPAVAFWLKLLEWRNEPLQTE
jgi:hypothetical protein